MRITPKQYAILLYEITKEVKKGELQEAVQSFVKILLQGRALPMLSRILELYKAYYNAQEGVVDVEVMTAREMTRKILSEFEKSVAQAFRPEVRAEALSYDIVTKVNPSVLGGARIKVGDYMLDDTLKARLTRLKTGLSYGR